jgi:CDGSH-type Zn-finger protein/uncharacterized Fe-S cluster protein YjdI
MARERISTYEGETLTITYDRGRCIHAAECGRGSKVLFDVSKDPWCDPDLVTTEEAVRIVERCPSGALSYTPKGDTPAETMPKANEVWVHPHGPLYVHGDIDLQAGDGREQTARVALCRCGQSALKPYCDGSHEKAKFRDAGPINSDLEGDALPAGPLAINLADGGPLLLKGPHTLYAGSGRPAKRSEKNALCRCGHSKNKPFCDGSHKDAGFTG